MRTAGFLVLLSWLGLLPASGAEPMAEIVVSIRYPQQTGTSHAHLYLYRVDGKLLRQLTNDNTGQDADPVFSPDGATIVFRRGQPGGVRQCWSIEPRGGGLRQISAPDWYTQTKSSPAYDHFVPTSVAPWVQSAGVDPREIVTPSGKVAIKIVPAAGVEDPGSPDKWDVLLRLNESGQTTKIGELPGYSAGFLSIGEDYPEECLLQDGPLEAAFCFVHSNSTDGDTVYALDLHTKQFIRLSPNMANPLFPLRGEAAFLTRTENRYVPYGDGKHTANCSYIERWDASWRAIRYAKAKTPAICYGASMYRPGRNPRIVTLQTVGTDQ